GSLSARLEIMERELAEARALTASSATPLAEAQDRQLSLTRENATLAERVAGLERALEEARAQTAGSVVPLAEAQARQLELAGENGSLGERVASLERELGEARQKAAGLTEQAPGVRDRANDLIDDLAEASWREPSPARGPGARGRIRTVDELALDD